VLEVRVPAHLTPDDERRCVADMVRRFERRGRAERHDLEARASRLARRYDLPRPSSIDWSDRQRRRWGSCQPETGRILLSTVLAGFPTWVLDYVIVHELAHLAEPAHDAEFHALVARYPKAERAEGFLIAKGLDDEIEEPHAPPVSHPEPASSVSPDPTASALSDVEQGQLF
jgi:predicted metal-dependent hydrolase